MTDKLPAFLRSRPLPLLLLICVLAWLPGFFTLPALDRDESRFAQATKQMLETRDFVDINLGSGPRYEKPVGIYWLQAASTALLGGGVRDAIWTYRVPSLLGALASVAATFWLARAIAGVEAAFYAGLILGLSVLLMSEAKIAKTDAVLLATTTVAQAIILRTYLSTRTAASAAAPSAALIYGGWAAFGLGVLIKGPVIALVCVASLIAIIVWDRDSRWLARLRPLSGLAIAIAIVLPWAIAIGIASHGLFYQKSLGGDFASKLMGEQEAHGAPPGYYTALVSITFWPGTLLLIPGLVYAFARRQEAAIRYLLCWAATTWLMFEFAPTKLPHYVLPAYPALAILCAQWLVADAGAESRGLARGSARRDGSLRAGRTYARGLSRLGAAAFRIGCTLVAVRRRRVRRRGIPRRDSGPVDSPIRPWNRRRGNRGDPPLRRRRLHDCASTDRAVAVAPARRSGRASFRKRRSAGGHRRLCRAKYHLSAWHPHRARRWAASGTHRRLIRWPCPRFRRHPKRLSRRGGARWGAGGRAGGDRRSQLFARPQYQDHALPSRSARELSRVPRITRALGHDLSAM
jgi:hypothetical protein